MVYLERDSQSIIKMKPGLWLHLLTAVMLCALPTYLHASLDAQAAQTERQMPSLLTQAVSWGGHSADPFLPNSTVLGLLASLY